MDVRLLCECALAGQTKATLHPPTFYTIEFTSPRGGTCCDDAESSLYLSNDAILVSAKRQAIRTLFAGRPSSHGKRRKSISDRLGWATRDARLVFVSRILSTDRIRGSYFQATIKHELHCAGNSFPSPRGSAIRKINPHARIVFAGVDSSFLGIRRFDCGSDFPFWGNESRSLWT